jgi:hypothetical protein
MSLAFDARGIARAGIRAVDPSRAVRRHLRPIPSGFARANRRFRAAPTGQVHVARGPAAEGDERVVQEESPNVLRCPAREMGARPIRLARRGVVAADPFELLEELHSLAARHRAPVLADQR